MDGMEHLKDVLNHPEPTILLALYYEFSNSQLEVGDNDITDYEVEVQLRVLQTIKRQVLMKCLQRCWNMAKDAWQNNLGSC